MLQILLFGRIFCGEPVSSSPENALVRDPEKNVPEVIPRWIACGKG